MISSLSSIYEKDELNSIFNLISNYIKKKEFGYEYKNEYIVTQKLESEMNNLII